LRVWEAACSVGTMQVVLGKQTDHGVINTKKGRLLLVVRDRWEPERKVTTLRVGVWPQSVSVVQIVLLYTHNKEMGKQLDIGLGLYPNPGESGK